MITVSSSPKRALSAARIGRRVRSRDRFCAQSEDATFVHDHTVAGTPQQNHGSYRVHLRGIFVLCSAAGLESGACVATLSPLEGVGLLPLATTVNGQLLTSVEAIEAAAAAVLVGTISGK